MTNVINYTNNTNNIQFYGNNNELIVTIKPTGEIILGQGANVDAAAKVFWEAVELWNPYRELKAENELLKRAILEKLGEM